MERKLLKDLLENNDLLNINLANLTVKDYLKQEEINENTLLLNYKTLLARYLSQGEPSEDTLRSYYSFIDNYLKWCFANKCHPLKITEYQFMYYRDFLIKSNLKKRSIKTKLNAIKQFYNIAVKLKLIETNPAKDVSVKSYEPNEFAPMKFLTLEQLKHLLSVIPDYDGKHSEYLRDRAIIMLMALEGLRTVEVHRMSINDINWDMKTIYIHGKGHNDFIYPRQDVLLALKEYIKVRPFEFTNIDKFGEPVFTAVANHGRGCRLDRRGIRYNIDRWLEKAGYKKAGLSCHMLRHTCGTLLYAKTKDLQIVKEVLRHSDINITSKYAHVYNNLDNRYTSTIDLNLDDK